MSKVELVVFDIAGTIIEDNGEVIGAYRAALRANDITVSVEELKESRGASKREVIAQLVERQAAANPNNERRITKAYQDFQTELKASYSNGKIKQIAGAAATLKWLKQRGIVCAVTTGFFRSVTDLILRSTGWDGMIGASICSDDVKHGRPAPYMIFHAMEATGIHDVRKVLTVGDTALDIQAGHRAGVLGVIGVLTGTHKEERLRRESPSHLIASVAELPDLIESQYSKSPRSSATHTDSISL